MLGSGTATGAPNYQLVFPARPVEHVGEVVWITSFRLEEDFRSTLIETDADLVVASTDGLEKVAILQREQRPFPGFFHPAGPAGASGTQQCAARCPYGGGHFDEGSRREGR